MVKVVGVRFKKAGKVYYFDPGALEPAKDEPVIVETKWKKTKSLCRSVR